MADRSAAMFAANDDVCTRHHSGRLATAYGARNLSFVHLDRSVDDKSSPVRSGASSYKLMMWELPLLTTHSAISAHYFQNHNVIHRQATQPSAALDRVDRSVPACTCWRLLQANLRARCRRELPPTWRLHQAAAADAGRCFRKRKPDPPWRWLSPVLTSRLRIAFRVPRKVPRARRA